MTADNWNVTDFYMIAAQLHMHEGSRQMSAQKTRVIEQNTRGKPWRMQAGILLESEHSAHVGFRYSQDKMEVFLPSQMCS